MDTKKCLKRIREHLDRKEYVPASDLCEKLIQEEPSNYMALIFAGLARFELNRTEESIECYNSAAKLESEKPLAWQGLFKVYTRTKRNPDESFLQVLNKVDSFTQDPEKKLEYSIWRIYALLILGRCDEGREHSKNILIDKWDEKTAVLIVELLGPLDILPAQLLEPVNNAIGFLTNQVVACDSLLQHILKFRLLHSGVDEIRKVAVEAAKSSWESTKNFGVDILCRLAIIQWLKTKSTSSIDKEYLPEELTRMIELVEEEEWEEISDLLAGSGDKPFSHEVETFLHFITSYLMSNHVAAIKYGEEGMEYAKKWGNIFPVNTMKLDLAKLYYGLTSVDSFKKCIELTEEICGEESASDPFERRVKILETYARIELEGCGTVWKTVFSLENMKGIPEEAPEYWTLMAWIQLKEERISDAENSVMKASEGVTQTAWVHFVAGRVLLEAGRPVGVVLKELLTSAKLDPNHAATFFYLGQCYHRLGSADNAKKAKAIRCLERAWELDSKLVEAAEALSDAYADSIDPESKELNKNLLEEVTESHDPREALWAWLRLAQLKQAEGEFETAIKMFQSASAACPDNPRVWECLGDAYLSRGSYESALKAFQIVLAKSKNSQFYAKLRLAQISLAMGNYVEALDELADKTGFSNLQTGLLLLLQGQAFFKRHTVLLEEARYGRAFHCLSQSVSSIENALQHELDTFSSCYALLGSSFLSLQHNFPQIWMEDSNITFQRQPVLTHKDLIASAIKAYSTAIKLAPKQTSELWEGLGTAYSKRGQLSQAQENKESDQGSMKSTVNEDIDKSIICFKKAAGLCPSSANAWLLLGIAYSRDKNSPALAQHYFIRALKSDSRHPGAWTSLGIFYLQRDNIQLAHRCFSMAQAADPNYPNSWCMQAVVAQSLGHHDALDLYRHTLQLHPLPLAASSYAYMLLENANSSTEKNKFQSVPVRLAADSLSKNCELSPNSTGRLNLLGCMLEQDGMEKAAFESFRSATEQMSGDTISENLYRLQAKLRKTTDDLSCKSSKRSSVLKVLAAIYNKQEVSIDDVLHSSEDGEVVSKLGHILELPRDTPEASPDVPTQCIIFLKKLLREETTSFDAIQRCLKRALFAPESSQYIVETSLSLIVSSHWVLHTHKKLLPWIAHSFPYHPVVQGALNGNLATGSGHLSKALGLKRLNEIPSGREFARFFHSYAACREDDQRAVPLIPSKSSKRLADECLSDLLYNQHICQQLIRKSYTGISMELRRMDWPSDCASVLKANMFS